MIWNELRKRKIHVHDGEPTLVMLEKLIALVPTGDSQEVYREGTPEHSFPDQMIVDPDPISEGYTSDRCSTKTRSGTIYGILVRGTEAAWWLVDGHFGEDPGYVELMALEKHGHLSIDKTIDIVELTPVKRVKG